MSNKVNLVATTFEQPVQGTKTHGFRMYDEYSKTYDNTSESPITDDLELLKYAKDCEDETVDAMIDHIITHETGIEINGQWYDWDEIKGIIQ